MNFLKKSMIVFLIVVGVLTAGTYLFLQQPVYGKNPRGKRLERIKQSPNYHDGAFQNEHETPVIREDASYWSMTKDFIWKPENNEPSFILPSIKTDLKALVDSVPQIIWFGHSTYLISMNGLKILVDPVLSGNASPFSWFGKSYKGSDIYTIDDLPEIDVCIISHDHYDHLDYRTIRALHPKVKQFCTALGVGAHLEDWGVPLDKIHELDWWESATLADSLRITAAPARHFSGRGIVRAKTLWASFILQKDATQIYVGGDSGYDTHFKRIGDQFGPFDLVMLECGQYGKDWPLIHMTPEETALAASELKAKVLLPVHWAKFSLALHPWNEPIERLLEANEKYKTAITTPLIGQAVSFKANELPRQQWWK